jgi:DNA-binding NarL/FixJ family response regulator
MDTKDNFLRILVADDNELIRKGLCSLLQKHPGWLVCAEATGGRDAIEKAVLLKPNVILVDVSMPDLNGFEVARRIHEQLRYCKILIVTEHDSRSFAHIPPQPGVQGYVMKSRLSSELIPAVEAASERQPSISASGGA